MKTQIDIPIIEDIAFSEYPIFKGVAYNNLEILQQKAFCQKHHRGNIIAHQGSRINSAFIVIKGVLKTYKIGFDGKEQIIRFEKTGDIIGYDAIISDEPIDTSSEIIEDSILCQIPAETLIQLFKSCPEFAINILKYTYIKMDECDKCITNMAQKTVRERLAELLINLMKLFDIEKDGTLKIALTREELANTVGTATESIIRTLADFKSINLIDLEGRKIRLLNIPELIKLGNIHQTSRLAQR